jgi:MscS family membrane protein
VVVFWAIFRILDVIGEIALTGPWAKTHPTSVSLVPLLVRAGKIAVIPLALIAAMSELGYPVASLLAGLGIGGLALALAAQKTVENLFGSVSIGVDQPFRIGDYVKIEDFAGTVEAIGLRSTRVRTLDRTLITIPNGKLADTRVETFAARDRIRLNVALNLAFGTTAAQVREVLAGIEALLRDHPRIWPDDLTVRLTGLGPSALEVTVMCWFATKDWGEFLRIREELLLRMLERVEQAGTSLAYPTSAVQLLEPRR